MCDFEHRFAVIANCGLITSANLKITAHRAVSFYSASKRPVQVGIASYMPHGVSLQK